MRSWPPSAPSPRVWVNANSASFGSRSSMPMRHLTVTGSLTEAFTAATQSATSVGSAFRPAHGKLSLDRNVETRNRLERVALHLGEISSPGA